MSTTGVYPSPPTAAPSWSATPDLLDQWTKEIIEKDDTADDKIAAATAPRFENTFKLYAQNMNKTYSKELVSGFFQHVSPDKSLRDASAASEDKLSSHSIDAGTREDVYNSFKKALEKDGKSLDTESSRFATKLEKSYRKNGLALPKETRDKVVELKKQLSNLQIEFGKQLAEENGHLEFTKEELEGLPVDVFEQYATTDDGKFKVTFKYPDILPVFKYVKNQDVRRRAYVGFDERGTAFNKDLVIKAVSLRAEIAQLLGYKNHADLVLDDRMAKNSAAVKDFLYDLLEKTQDKGKEEIKLLIDLKNKDLKSRGLEPQSELYAYDFAFYNNYLLETEYKVDAEKISQYFPVQQTIEKMFGIFSHLFKIDFVKQAEANAWHPDVELFQVWNHEKKEFIGYLYLDLHPREGKYGHAANFSLIKRSTDLETGDETYPVTALVCNFSKSTASKPALLKHSEVTTFFHELGHGIHDLVGRSKYASLSGTSVDWDFVEAPSQMLEYWTWSKDQIIELSAHYKDGSKMPEETAEALVRSKHVLESLATLRQLFFGIFDFTVHTKTPEEAANLDLTDLWNRLREEVSLVKNNGIRTSGYAAFGHIMGGYDSGYYGYLWSLVFASDMFHSKFAKDPMDSHIGLEYLNKVIGRGGSEDADKCLVEFLGREPNNKAFLKELGISA